MASPDVKVTRWPAERALTENAILEGLRQGGLTSYKWSNGPGDTYQAHSHAYNKVIYVVSGSITFGLPDLGRDVLLVEGDRLDLPSGVVHDATVGPRGVVCLEAHR